ncbi:hypothetical protein LBMAG56_46730 [Verrucomicrobiota bacterium]|nr:hypothetical protein LBMAG56_46730 [Verrucomicrobiota bacterium]
MDTLTFHRLVATARSGAPALPLAMAVFLTACGREPAPTTAAPPASAAPAAEVSILPTSPAPAAEISATPSVTETAIPGQALPQPTTEMMLQFEARFGRPPTNYSELRRLNQPAPKPAPR